MIDAILKDLHLKKDLTESQMVSLMTELMEGSLSDKLIAEILIALSKKGETVDEISHAVKVIKRYQNPIHLSADDLLDIVGTGGDGHHTFNISTVSAFVAASSGVKIAKHGNRSASSASGSADLLETAGINLAPDEKVLKSLIETLNIGFMYAPNYHPALKKVKNIRKVLGVKTIFNLLGPLLSPVNAKKQVVGVYDKKWVLPICVAFQKEGSQHTMVVHSEDGMDEISIYGKTFVSELKDNEIKSYEITPDDYGMRHTESDALTVNSSSDSLKVILDVLNGVKGEARDIVLLNAGAAIYCGDKALSLIDGIAKAAHAIDSKKALQTFNEYKIKSHRLC